MASQILTGTQSTCLASQQTHKPLCCCGTQAIDAGNFCQTDAVKAAFTSGGWDQAYFGKRLWDSKSVAMVVKALIPATSAEAVREIIEELRTQANGLLDMMQKAADDAVSVAWRVALDVVGTLVI